MTRQIVIVGGGFAGLWSAVAAARRLRESGAEARIVLINKDAHHSIRVRNYEADLSDTLIELKQVLDPIGVDLMLGEVEHIDTARRSLRLRRDGAPVELAYDKLILASGSRIARPPVDGLAEFSFDIDTHAAAMRLQSHIAALAATPRRAGRYTAIVIGSGATGVELATELPQRLRAAAGAAGAVDEVRVILADRQSRIAGGLGSGQPVIERACAALGVELLPDFALAAVDADGVLLADGGRVAAATVVWCAGMQADALTQCIPGRRDAQGRLMVDAYMRVEGVPDVYAAGDTAHALIDGEHASVMSCQHARPMGRYAGANAVDELLGREPTPLHIDWYTNIIDLGAWGAVYTQGRDRVVVAEGEKAKHTKSVINRQRIYPPRDGDRAAILAAGGLELQPPPLLPPLATPG